MGANVDIPSRTNAVGRIVAIHGSVVDVRFDDQLPAIHSMLRSGSKGEVIIEVAALTGPHTIRGLIFKIQQALALGMPVSDTGAPHCSARTIGVGPHAQHVR